MPRSAAGSNLAHGRKMSDAFGSPRMSQDDEQKPFDAPTPQVGTPSFDELDASVAEVPFVGPTPDRAADYAAPRPLPKVSDHRTMEIETVKVKPQEDPRKALTIKNLRTLEKEQRPASASEPDAGQGSMPPAVQPAAAPSKTKRNSGIAVALIAGVLLMLVVVLMTSTTQPPAEPTMGKVDLAAPPALATIAEEPGTGTPQPVARPASPGLALKVVTPVPPTPQPAATPSAAPKPVATETPAAKPIFTEDGKDPAPKTPAKPAAAPKPLFE